MQTKPGKNKKLKSLIVLLGKTLQAQETNARLAEWTKRVGWWIESPIYDYKQFFFPSFIYIIRAKHFFISGRYFSLGIWKPHDQGLESSCWKGKGEDG